MLLKFKSINISDMSVKTFTLDQQAKALLQPVTPRYLIIIVGGIIGLIGGVFLAFLLNIIQNQKNRSEKG
jgi:LPS O-antigen subunit length determinant protein (WzzB/FepE family)